MSSLAHHDLYMLQCPSPTPRPQFFVLLSLICFHSDRARKALTCRKHMQFEVAHADAWYGCEFQLIDPNYPIYTEPYSAFLEPFPSTGVGGTGSSSKKGRPSWTTFYLREIVKPRVPVGLSLQPLQDNGGFELSWKTCYTKSDFIASNLKFQVNISRQSDGHWKTTDVGENHKRHFSKQELLRGHRYAFRVRAMPSGSYVKGFWSSWSSVLEKTFSAASCPDCTEGDDVTWTDNWMLQLSPLGIILVGFLIVGGVVFYKWVKPSLWPEIPDAGKAFERIVQGKQSAAGFLNSTGSESLMVWEYQVSHIIDPETDE
uniref:Fibronectin type-III domain-containing protein n=1 Tax=Eptatretus burgeri TaxID=7764 RepID=A0A8C4WX05_EPTBU